MMRRWQGNRGAVLMTVAIVLVAIIGCVALVVDMGRLYLVRQWLVNTCDAAALGGGLDLPHQETARLRAQQVGLANALYIYPDWITFPTANRIRVEASHDVNLGFARILGLGVKTVGAYAVVERIGGVGWVSGMVVPWGIPDVNYVRDQTVILKLSSQMTLANNQLAGNFFPLAFDEPGGSEYSTDTKYGYDGIVRVGDIVPSEPGNLIGPTSQAVVHDPVPKDALFEQAAREPYLDDTCQSFDFGNPRVVIVPIISSLGNGRTDVTVLGFAAFFILGFEHGQVTGCFVDYTLPSEDAGGTGPDYGVGTYGLIE